MNEMNVLTLYNFGWVSDPAECRTPLASHSWSVLFQLYNQFRTLHKHSMTWECLGSFQKCWKFCCNTKSKNNPLMKLKTLEKQSQRQTPVIPALEVTASSRSRVRPCSNRVLRNEVTTIKFLLSTWEWKRKQHRQLDLWVPGQKTT